jgi:hypothetical protein
MAPTGGEELPDEVVLCGVGRVVRGFSSSVVDGWLPVLEGGAGGGGGTGPVVGILAGGGSRPPVGGLVGVGVGSGSGSGVSPLAGIRCWH